MIVSLSSLESIAAAKPESGAAESGNAAEAQKVIREQSQKFLSGCIAKENAATEKGHSDDDVVLNEAYRKLVLDFLSSFDKMETTHLRHLDWLNPVLLTWCTRSKFEPIQKGVHDLLEKTSPASAEPKPEPEPEPEPES